MGQPPDRGPHPRPIHGGQEQVVGPQGIGSDPKGARRRHPIQPQRQVGALHQGHGFVLADVGGPERLPPEVSRRHPVGIVDGHVQAARMVQRPQGVIERHQRPEQMGAGAAGADQEDPDRALQPGFGERQVPGGHGMLRSGG